MEDEKDQQKDKGEDPSTPPVDGPGGDEDEDGLGATSQGVPGGR